MKFDKPTLITLTAPTCSGKSYLLQHLSDLGYPRIVSTTTRAPREGEVEGVDYYFITRELSQSFEASGAFAEIIEFRGTRYGVTHSEMLDKMQSGLPPIVILEPKGLQEYEKYCAKHGWGIYEIFVSTPEAVRIQRLNTRTVMDIQAGKVPVDKIVSTHTDRLLSITGEERLWMSTGIWDAIVDGQNIDLALDHIQKGIKWRNSQNAEATM